MDFVTTVLGDIASARLGHCQPHEHVYINGTVALATRPELRLTDFCRSLRELELYRRAGGDSLVDAQPLAAGRDALALRDASRLSGVAVVACTGYHLPFFYPEGHWIFTDSEDCLADLFLSELTTGMYLGGGFDRPDPRTDIRAGVVKCALTETGVSGRSESLLRAAGRAAAGAGAPILLHTERGVGAVDAVRLLGDLGLPPERIMICHVDRQVADYGVHEAIADTGAYLEYDTITLFEHHDNAGEIRLIEHMVGRGHLERILLATDPTADRLKSHGSPVGMDYLLTGFLPLLRVSGFTDSMIDTLCRVNPARALARFGKFSPSGGQACR